MVFVTVGRLLPEQLELVQALELVLALEPVPEPLAPPPLAPPPRASRMPR